VEESTKFQNDFKYLQKFYKVLFLLR